MPISKPVGGVATGTLAIGEALTVAADPGAVGRVVVFPGTTATPTYEARDVEDGQTVTLGPFLQPRLVRVYTTAGNVQASTSLPVPAGTVLQPAVISDDRLTISGQGAVPDSRVQVFDQDTGLAIGTTQPIADVIGEWTLTLASPLPLTTRVNYVVSVFGPYGAQPAPNPGEIIVRVDGGEG